MVKYFRRMIFVSCLVLLSGITISAVAQSTLVSITPNVELRTAGTPPAPGVELFVFAPSAPGTEYTAVFSVQDQPAIAVVLPSRMKSYSYDANAKTLTLVFQHIPFLDGIELFGPSTDFSVALVPAVNLGENGPPAEMRGSWMTSNLGPNNWQLIPPSPTNPAFGYSLTGPAGQTGEFDMFIPQSMFDLLSVLFQRPITADDLAVYNGSAQSTLSIEAQAGGGALVELDVLFSSTDTELREQEEESLSGLMLSALGSNVTKRITVNREQDLSFAVSPSGSIKKGKLLKVFGCLGSKYSFRVGEKISLEGFYDSRGRSKAYLTSLDSKGCFSRSFKMYKDSTLFARLAKNKTLGRAKEVKSRSTKVKVRK